MNDTKSDSVVKIREHKPPEWFVDSKGRKHLKGKWNHQRVAEFLVENPSWQTVDDLARVIYGFAGKVQRVNVRKHIPAQRRYMLNSLEQPIITQFGERGRIFRVKLYNKVDEFDRILLKMELDKALQRKELSDKRYDDLKNIFLLPMENLPSDGNGGKD